MRIFKRKKGKPFSVIPETPSFIHSSTLAFFPQIFSPGSQAENKKCKQSWKDLQNECFKFKSFLHKHLFTISSFSTRFLLLSSLRKLNSCFYLFFYADSSYTFPFTNRPPLKPSQKKTLNFMVVKWCVILEILNRVWDFFFRVAVVTWSRACADDDAC